MICARQIGNEMRERREMYWIGFSQEIVERKGNRVSRQSIFCVKEESTEEGCGNGEQVLSKSSV